VDGDVTTHGERGYFTRNTGAEERASSNMSMLDASSCQKFSEHCGREVEEVVWHLEKEKNEEKPVERPLRQLCRDEWDCDFCGPECFCDWAVKVEAMGEAMC
jgi:hypothetical protein